MNFRDEFSLYFIKPVGSDGPIKIGLSSDPQRRLREFGTWSPVALEIIGIVPGRWADEQFLHDCLAEHHLHGEWFRASKQVLDVVQSVLTTGGTSTTRNLLAPIANVRSIKNRAARSRAANSNTESAA